MAVAMSVRVNVAAAPAVVGAGASRVKIGAAGSSVRFTNGLVAFKRASLVLVRAETTEPGPAGRSGSSPAGLSGAEAPLGVVTKSGPLDQGSEAPVSERMAYVCQDCGYVYADEAPFEDLSEDYNCPQCTAPKARFLLANASVGEMLDTTKEN